MTSPAVATASAPAQLKMVNYFPSAAAQGLFWNPWNPAMVAADFTVIEDTLHANAVRVFVPTQQFGWPVLNSSYTSELSQLITIAANHHLGVFLNLFNYYVPVTHVADSENWAADLLAPYKGDSRVVAVEVENEINRFIATNIIWAKAIIPYIQNVDGGIPVTISICGCDNTGDLSTLHTSLGTNQPSFYDFHYYPDPNADPTPAEAQGVTEARIQAVFQTAKSIVSPVPVIVGETGVSTYYGPPIGIATSNSIWERIRPDYYAKAEQAASSSWERIQADYYTKAEQAAQAAGIAPAAPWDYIDTRYNGGVSDVRQRFFGLFRSDGTAKPAASVIAQAFSS